MKIIKFIDKAEENLILTSFNSNYYEYDKNKTILQIFAENVEKHKFDTALVFEKNEYSYFDLDNMSSRLANYLIYRGINKNSVIGIMLERSVSTIVCMLGILKANMAYMLIEKDLPEDRINYMLKNADSPLLITSSNVPFVNAECEKVYFEELVLSDFESDAPSIKEKPQDYMSVVYTSGSTGKPKGALIKRFSVVNLVNGYKASMNTDSLNNFLSICSVAFDMFAAEVWIALLSGKKLVLANEEEAKNPIQMSKLIEDQKCKFMLITSSKLDLLLSNPSTSACLKNIKAMQLGGEVLDPLFYKKVAEYTDAKIYNGYGPSETTSCCTCKYITSADDINIGKPLPNIQIYICNDDLNLCPIGVTGELCVAGDGVSYGYINNKATTNEKFVKNPFGLGNLYKTGDLAKWTENGDIEYVGRNDFQIKIRGLRVELEEIDNKLRSIPGVEKAITVVRKVNGHDAICSYVVAGERELRWIAGGKTQSLEATFNDSARLDETKLKVKLSRLLPHYMVPAHIMVLNDLPLSTNGKVDRKKLPEIVVKIKYVPPKTKMQKYVTEVFAKFLNVDKVSLDADFFDLGGDSLTAIKIITHINSELNVDLSIKDIFENSSVMGFSKKLRSMTDIKSREFENSNVMGFSKRLRSMTDIKTEEKVVKPKAGSRSSYPTTSAQKRIFFSLQTDKKTKAYNTPGGILFNFVPSVKKLEQCFNRLIKRHDALRTYFVIERDEVVQKIARPFKFELEAVKADFAKMDEEFKDFVKPFDLSVPPLFRAKLVIFENVTEGNGAKCVLFMDFNHIICDGASIGIFIKEFCDLYNKVALPKKEYDYRDFSIWEQDYFKSVNFKEDKDFWLGEFGEKAAPNALEMPTTYSRPSSFSYEGAKLSYELTHYDKLLDVCKRLNTTPYMFLLSAYYVLLQKYTGQDDIVVGTPLEGRKFKEISDVIGMFVNTLALRNKVDKEISFKDLVQNVTKHCLDCFKHSSYPFDKIVDDIGIARDPSRNPIFDTMFVYQNEDMPEVEIGGGAKYFVPDNNTAKFDFMLEVIPKESYFKLNLEYRTKLFDENFMKNLVRHYEEIVKSVLDNYDKNVVSINMLPDDEKAEILDMYSNNMLEYPKKKSIIELFEEQVSAHPRSCAVIHNGERYSYKQLDEKSTQFANYLKSRGVEKGDFVATLLDRSYNLIVAIWGILKCGAVYTPISPEFPEERIEYIVSNCKPKIVVIDSVWNGNEVQTVDIRRIKLDTISTKMDNELKLLPDDAIYCIYTSGSTGKPKGVVVKNQNLNNFVHSMNKLFGGVGIEDTMISTTSICFDVSIFEIFFSLLNGTGLYLYKSDTIEDIFDFCDTLVKEKITIAYIPPNILNEVHTILAKDPKSCYLQKLLIGVEPIKCSIAKKYFDLNPNIKIVNGYGPTETTICCTAFPVTKASLKKYINLPIGKPLHNLNAFVLDKDLKPVPIGVPGELYISGDNVTLGYLGNKRMTREKYIECPFGDGLMYATGDVVKVMPDKNIMFVGRNDSQVKIKGHRIELSEITGAIETYPSVTKSYIIVKRQKIAAYFTADTQIIVNDLRNYLAMKLPFYAIPNYFVQLASFPLTINGKIDKKELDKIELRGSDIYEEPHNEFEAQLAALWQQFLNVERVGINDNFFDLGGDSLIAIRMQVEAFRLGLNISYADIFKYPTIKQLSDKIEIAQPNSSEHKNNLKNYNYKKIEKVLEQNDFPVNNHYKKQRVKNVLLTGATGFVGIHILGDLLANTDAKIYCLVRNKNTNSSISRLLHNLDFYFSNKYDKFIGNRIKVVDGDISEKNLGLSDENYRRIGKKVKCVINSAAIVKHYGMSDVFEKTNIQGVKNVIAFCKEFNAKLYHLSTLSVSGNVFLEDSYTGAKIENETNFYEKDLYIDQDISNVYVYTKFMAERAILEEIAKGSLSATILRLGNITSRFSDGKFQINISDNAYLNRLLSFIRLGCIPDYMLEGYGEFTPVDYVAKAITKIIQVKQPYSVLHIFNNLHCDMDKLIDIFVDYGIDMKILPEDEFLKVVDEFLEKDKNVLSGIINDFNEDKKLVYDSNIVLQNDFTNEFLAKLDFEWIQIGKVYLFRYLDYLKSLGYIGG